MGIERSHSIHVKMTLEINQHDAGDLTQHADGTDNPSFSTKEENENRIR